MKEYITIKELAEEYLKDTSYIAKLLIELQIPTVTATKEGHACKAISFEDKAKLEMTNPHLVAPTMTKEDIKVSDIATERGQDVSGLLKLLKKKGFALEKKRSPEGGKPVAVLSKKEHARLTKEHPIRIKL